MKKRQFRLKFGTHRDGKTVYTAGSLVPSDRDLMEIFQNKFEEVEGDDTPDKAPPKKRRRRSSPKKESEEASPKEETSPSRKKQEPLVGLSMRFKGSGLYDVINDETGEALNDTPLSKEEAEELVFGQ